MLRLLAGEAARRFGVRTAFDTGSASLSFSDLDRLSDEGAQVAKLWGAWGAVTIAREFLAGAETGAVKG